MGINRKIANKITWLKQPIAENSHDACAARRGSKWGGTPNQTPLLIRSRI